MSHSNRGDYKEETRMKETTIEETTIEETTIEVNNRGLSSCHTTIVDQE